MAGKGMRQRARERPRDRLCRNNSSPRGFLNFSSVIIHRTGIHAEWKGGRDAVTVLYCGLTFTVLPQLSCSAPAQWWSLLSGPEVVSSK